jgi:hypothetical protein
MYMSINSQKYLLHKNNTSHILEFADYFNEPLDAYIPILYTVTIVKFGYKFIQNNDILPNTIEYII